MLNQVSCRFEHAFAVAGWTDTTPFARIGDKEILSACFTADASKSIRQNTALQKLAQIMLNIIGDRALIRIGFALCTQPGFQMVLDDLVSCRSFGLPALIYAGDSGWFLGEWGFAGGHLYVFCFYGIALS
jgi:hypothetical protein